MKNEGEKRTGSVKALLVRGEGQRKSCWLRGCHMRRGTGSDLKTLGVLFNSKALWNGTQRFKNIMNA